MSSHLGWQATFEAVWELIFARIATLMPARIYARLLEGVVDAIPAGARTEEARALSELIERLAARMPFRALCLQQVIALRRMLNRRGLSCTVVLGVSPNQIGDAHAWLKVGETVVSGEEGIDRFQVIAEFT